MFATTDKWIFNKPPVPFESHLDFKENFIIMVYDEFGLQKTVSMSGLSLNLWSHLMRQFFVETASL